jgi:primosomal protein N'
MIAQIYVIKRMPRRFSFFDYKIPDGMELKRGDLVQVPFRNSQVRGIVANTKSESEAPKIKDVTEILEAGYLSDPELTVYETTANEIIQSVPTVLDAAFLPARKRSSKVKPIRPSAVTNKIRTSEVDFIRKSLNQISESKKCFIQTQDIVQIAAILEGWMRSKGMTNVSLSCRSNDTLTCVSPTQQTLILVSHVHDADMIASALIGSDPDLVVLDSRATKPQRADIAQAWRSGQIKTLIATRIGSILPASDLEHIFVVRSGSAEHAQYDRNPRYDARNMVWKWHKIYNTNLTFFDVVLRVVDTVHFQEPTTYNLPPTTSILNLKQEHQISEVPILSEPVLKHISDSLQNKKKVIISYNYKSEDGNQKVEALLREKYPESRIQRIEKPETASGVRPAACDIILATQYYFENILNPFKESDIGLVIELLADLGLSDSYYTATEDTMRRLLELQGLAQRFNCPFLIQTWSAEMIKQMLSDPKAMLQAETEVRQQFNYPPFGQIWRAYSKTDPPPQINKLPESANASEHGQFLEIKAASKDIDQINQILQTLPDSYIIEVNPERERKL